MIQQSLLCGVVGLCFFSTQAFTADSTGNVIEKVESDKDPRRIKFSGVTWITKRSSGLVGPGPNYFADGPENIWVDDAGRLHLTIRKDDQGHWACTEIIAEGSVGYGRYEFYLDSAMGALDPNVVLGLFTWDTKTWKTEINAEIDIEVSQWANPLAPNLHFTVQPGWGPDTESGKYAERTLATHMDPRIGQSAHVFNWQADRVTFASHSGLSLTTGKPFAEWQFTAEGNLGRHVYSHDVKGLKSDAVLIPHPSPTTQTRINLWLVDKDRDGNPEPPSNNETVEVVISRFVFTPTDGAETP